MGEIGETVEMTETSEIIETNEAEIGMMETTDVGEEETMIEEITEIIETIETMIEETTEIETIETEKDLVKRTEKGVDPIMIIMKGGIGRKGQMMPAKTKVHRTSALIWERRIGAMMTLQTLEMRNQALMFTKM